MFDQITVKSIITNLNLDDLINFYLALKYNLKEELKIIIEDRILIFLKDLSLGELQYYPKELAKKEILRRKEKNYLIELLNMFPDKDWNWSTLSCNLNLTKEYFLNHQDKNWMRTGLMINHAFNLTWLKEHLNPLTEKELKLYIKLNKNVSWDEIKEESNKEWFWNKLTKNSWVHWDLIKDHLENADWRYLSQNSTIDLNAVLDKVNWDYLSFNPNLDFDFVEKHDDKNWSWHNLSFHPKLTSEFFKKYAKKSWSQYGLNLTLDWNFLKNFKQKDWFGLSMNPTVPVKELLNNDIYDICENLMIGLSVVKNNPKIPWNFRWLSSNPNITPEFILTFPDKEWLWDWDGLSKNNFTKDDKWLSLANKILNS